MKNTHAPWLSGVLASALLVCAGSAVCASALHAQDDQLADRAKRAGQVLSELVAVPDRSPPTSLMREAVCIAVVPGVVQAGFGIGGRAGYGLVSCRSGGDWMGCG